MGGVLSGQSCLEIASIINRVVGSLCSLLPCSGKLLSNNGRADSRINVLDISLETVVTTAAYIWLVGDNREVLRNF